MIWNSLLPAIAYLLRNTLDKNSNMSHSMREQTNVAVVLVCYGRPFDNFQVILGAVS